MATRGLPGKWGLVACKWRAGASAIWPRLFVGIEHWRHVCGVCYHMTGRYPDDHQIGAVTTTTQTSFLAHSPSSPTIFGDEGFLY